MSQYVSQTGAEVARFEYDPFGNLTVDAYSNATSFPFRFSTKPQDGVTGLYYYGYRWFDPVTGRWPSRDPIGERGGVNLYGFVGNHGLNRWDYLGLAILGEELHQIDYPYIDKETGIRKNHSVKFYFEVESDEATCTINVTVPIRFTKGRNYRNRNIDRDKQKALDLDEEIRKFEANIKEKWSGKFKLVCSADYDCKCEDGWTINVSIRRIGQDADQPGMHVIVGSNPGGAENQRADQQFWNPERNNVAAHEFGHMLGNPDEYLGPIDRTPDKGEEPHYKDWAESDPSIMSDPNLGVKDRHFEQVSRRFRDGSCSIQPVN